jgi:2'-5' RNA ligase
MRSKIKKVLLEYTNTKKDKDPYDYGCMMIYYDMPNWQKVLDMISDDDLYEDDTDQFGKEYEPHVTVLYGLHSDEVDDDELFSHIIDREPPTLSMSNISLFNNEKYDVIKFDVDGDGLHDMNKILRYNFPYTNNYPDYHPHSTIAYVKPGLGSKYVKKLSKPFVLQPNKLVYSKPDGSKITKEFNVK